MKRRILSLFLIFVLFLGLLPSVRAEETEGFNAYADVLSQMDRSEADELSELRISGQSKALRHETKGPDYAISPSWGMYGQHAKVGQTVMLEFALTCSGSRNYYWNVMIFQGTEITEESLTAEARDSFGNRNGFYEMSLEWDTAGYTPGEYLVISFVSYGNNIIGDVYGETVTLTAENVELQSIVFLDADEELPVYNLKLGHGEQAYFFLGYNPLNATTPDRSITVSSSAPEAIYVEERAGVIAVGAYSCGAAAVTAQAAGKSAVLYVEVPHSEGYICDICGKLTFTDVPANAWYYNNVLYAVKNGLMNGMGNHLFQPDGAMTRAQLVTVLWRYEGSPVSGTNSFTDVEEDLWYTQAVAWAAEQGIVSGVGGGKFHPDGTITREQLVTIVYRYSSMKKLNTFKREDLSAFPDQDKVSSWAMDAMQWAVSVGLVSGNAHNGNTWLEPQGNATRAQVSAIFQRFIQTIPSLTVNSKIALVTDFGDVDDAAFNEAAYTGIKNYCEANELVYTYYQPAEASTEARIAAVEQAVEEGATIVVLPGYVFGPVLLNVQDKYPQVKFIALDMTAEDLTEDYISHGTPSANTVCVTYKEEQAGYLAGYAAVKAGYIQLGFVGGMPVPAVLRYGNGFIRGANDAAEEMGLSDLVEIRYVYANQFYGDADITAYVEDLYANGTEVVFACGGGIYTSVAEAAAKCGGKVIGVDVDQSVMIDQLYGEDITFTSAMKGLSYTTEYLLELYFGGNLWCGGEELRLGIESGGSAQYGHIMLPATTQFNESFTEEIYTARWNLIAQGKVVVPDDITTTPEVAITVYYLDDIK